MRRFITRFRREESEIAEEFSGSLSKGLTWNA